MICPTNVIKLIKVPTTQLSVASKLYALYGIVPAGVANNQPVGWMDVVVSFMDGLLWYE